MSSGSSVNDALSGYLAGHVAAEKVVSLVAAAYYREQGAGSREQLKPIIEIIERAHPGVVELTSSGEKPGFAVKLAERPFPRRFESELREAVATVVTAPRSPLPVPGLFTRIARAIRKIFSA